MSGGNAIPFDYTEDPEQLKKPRDLRQPSKEKWEKMTLKQRKLHEIRDKANKARNQNYIEAVAEDVRNKEDNSVKAARLKAEHEAEKTKEEEELKSQGLDPKKEKLLNTTASEADYLNSWKEKKKVESDFGWDQFNNDKDHKVHEKRLKSAEQVFDDYEKQKGLSKEEDFYPTAHSLNYGTNKKPDSDEKIELLLNEMGKAREKNKNFSRKRAEPEGQYITYINDGNKEFNKKVSRAYDKYTVEIRQNLERGTAI